MRHGPATYDLALEREKLPFIMYTDIMYAEFVLTNINIVAS
jgi:hypothetical protein